MDKPKIVVKQNQSEKIFKERPTSVIPNKSDLSKHSPLRVPLNGRKKVIIVANSSKQVQNNQDKKDKESNKTSSSLDQVDLPQINQTNISQMLTTNQNTQIKSPMQKPLQMPTKPRNFTLGKLNSIFMEREKEKDREVLFDENQRLKAENTKFREEIHRLKTDYFKSDQEMKAKDKLIEELLLLENRNNANNQAIYNHITNSAGSPEMKYKNIKETALITNLKRDYKDLQAQVKSKEEELDKIKKMAKVTKFNEVLIENQTLHEEVNKMKQILEVASENLNSKFNKEFQSLQDSFNRQQILLMSIQEKNTKLQNDLEGKDIEIKNLADKYELCAQEMNNIQIFNQPATAEELKSARYIEKTKDALYYKDLAEEREKIINQINESHKKELQSNEENYTKKLLEMDIKIVELELACKAFEEEKNTINNINEIANGNSILSSINNYRLQHEILDKERFNEASYILIKNLEANELTYTIVVSKVLDEFYEGEYQKINDEIISKMAEKFLQIMKNKNENNFRLVANYLATFIDELNKGTLDNGNTTAVINNSLPNAYEEIKNHFNSLFESVCRYEKAMLIEYNNALKEKVAPAKFTLLTEVQKYDPNKTGYISFENLRKILSTIDIKLNEDLVEYFIFLLKKFQDENSSFGDLRYENILNLLVEDHEIHVEEIRRNSMNSITSSQILMTVEEFKQRSEAILMKFANYLIENKLTVAEVFANDVITITDSKGNQLYSIYLKMFLITLQKELDLMSLETADGICLFNRLRNPKNIFNIEVIDFDRLREEMKHFGVMEEENVKDDSGKRFNKIEEETYEDEKFEENLEDDNFGEIKNYDNDEDKDNLLNKEETLKSKKSTIDKKLSKKEENESKRSMNIENKISGDILITLGKNDSKDEVGSKRSKVDEVLSKKGTIEKKLSEEEVLSKKETIEKKLSEAEIISKNGTIEKKGSEKIDLSNKGTIEKKGSEKIDLSQKGTIEKKGSVTEIVSKKETLEKKLSDSEKISKKGTIEKKISETAKLSKQGTIEEKEAWEEANFNNSTIEKKVSESELLPRKATNEKGNSEEPSLPINKLHSSTSIKDHNTLEKQNTNKSIYSKNSFTEKSSKGRLDSIKSKKKESNSSLYLEKNKRISKKGSLEDEYNDYQRASKIFTNNLFSTICRSKFTFKNLN
jgi:hypothetical protein